VKQIGIKAEEKSDISKRRESEEDRKNEAETEKKEENSKVGNP